MDQKYRVRSEPNGSALSDVDVWPENFRISRARFAIHPIRGKHEIGVLTDRVIVHLELEVLADTQRFGPLLEDVQQASATNAAKPVATEPYDLATKLDFDVVPVAEVGNVGVMGFGNYTAKSSIVLPENTTPQPKVSSGRLRS